MEPNLITCPICGAKPRICEDIQDHYVRCTEDCPAPICPHLDPRDSALSWNDWARWYIEYNQGFAVGHEREGWG